MKKKLIKIFQGIAFISIIIAFIYVGTLDFSPKEVIDNEKFDQEYEMVSSDNVFVYASARDVYSALRGNAIIFMGFPNNKWTGYYANILNEAAKSSNIKEILYYDFYEDRNNKNATYQSIVAKLSNYVLTLDDGTKNIYSPTLIVIKNGNIVYFDNETALTLGSTKPEEYWTDLKVGLKTNSLKTMFIDYLTE
ncbi:MAG: hypothetical protein NC483_02645 [Ruminococcus sp.]|nr:hypothetical protein [Ruminococcus sp.]